MANIEKFKEAAGILQQVDVSAIVTSMALGIAEAQQALDDNSVAQTLILADPANGVGGVSLLELGFTPAFYHFQYADISAAISLKMSETTSFELDVSIAATYGKQGGFSQENYDFLSEDRSESARSEFKSSNDFSQQTSESESWRIANTNVAMNQSEGAVSKVQNFMQQIRDIDSYRVKYRYQDETLAFAQLGLAKSNAYVNYHAGYLSIALPVDHDKDHAILKAAAYDGTTIGLDESAGAGSQFDLDTDMVTTWPDALAANQGADVIGLTAGGYMDAGATAVKELKLNFKFDREDIDLTYHNNADVKKALEALRKALDTDSNLVIKIIGHADGVGDHLDYNVALSQRRIDAMKAWLTGKNCGSTQIVPDPQGETGAVDNVDDVNERYVKIEITSGADYYYFVNDSVAGAIDADDTLPAYGSDINGNEFVLAEDLDGAPSYTANFELGTVTVNASASSLTALQGVVTSQLDSGSWEHAHETKNEVAYFLGNESRFAFTVYNKNSNELEIESNSSIDTQTNENESSHLVLDSENSSSRLASEASNFEGSNQFAIGGTVDVRVARAFSMSVEGNASMSARLVSLPAPPDFLDKIKDFLS